MKLTIIPFDKLVIKDGEGYNVDNLDYLDSNINAIQWADTTGEIEYLDGTSNLTITDITPYNQCVTDWDTAKAQYITDTTPSATDWEAAFKRYRNSLLTDSDWTQVADNKLSDAKKTEWQTYRQALRDLPTTKTTTYQGLVENPSHSDYPTAPS